MCVNCTKLIRAGKDFLQAEDSVARDGRRDARLIDVKEKAIDALAEAILTVEGWPPRMRHLSNRMREV